MLSDSGFPINSRMRDGNDVDVSVEATLSVDCVTINHLLNTRPNAVEYENCNLLWKTAYSGNSHTKLSN